MLVNSAPQRRTIFIRHKRTLFCIAFVFLYSVSLSYAVPPTTKYAPGSTLDPLCTPGSTNCSVRILPEQSGNTNTYLTTDGSDTAWSTSTLILGGNFQTSGAYATTLTTTGTTALTLPTTGTLATTANINSAVSGTLNYVPKFTGTNTVGNSGIYDDGTNIGIGTASPSSKLQVSGDIRITSGSGGQIIFADGSTMSSSGLGSAAALSAATDAIVTGDSDANASGDIILKTGSNDRLHILNSGNVGINTATPSALFSVGASSPFQVTNLGAVTALSYAGAGTGLTGTASALTAGTVTTNANLTGVITSVGNATSIASQTGTGTTFVMSVSPTLTTPNLGTPSALTLTNATGLPAASVLAGTFGAGNYSFGTGTLTVGAITSSGALALGSNTITSGLINGQTISSAANFTGSVTGGAASFTTGAFSGVINASTGNGLNFNGSTGTVYGYYNSSANSLILANNVASGSIQVGAGSATMIISSTTGGATFTGAVIGGAATFSGSSSGFANGGILTVTDTDALAANVGGGIAFSGIYTGTTTTPFARIKGMKENATDGNYAGYLSLQTRANGASPTEAMRITSAGNVGIGTTVPNTYLTVKGNNTSGYGQLSIQSSDVNNAALATWYYNGTKTGEIGTTSTNFYSLAVNDQLFYTGGSERMRILGNGNIGIGTTSPNLNLGINSSTGDSYLQFTSTTSGTTINDGLLIGISSGGDALFTNREATNMRFQTDNEERMRITSAGNVGIGTTEVGANMGLLRIAYPYAKTDTTTRYAQAWTSNEVSGSTWKLNLTSTGSATAANRYFAFQTGNEGVANGGNIVFQADGGNVGIGTTGPGSKLTVSDTNKTLATAAPNLAIYSSDSYAADIGGYLGLGGYYNGSSVIAFAGIHGKKENATVDNALGYMAFTVRDGVGTNERMRISSAGNVGIGTTSPDSKLDVEQASNAQGQGIRGTYAANWYEQLMDGTGFWLGINGTARLLINQSTGAISVSSLLSCGGIQTNGSGTMSCTSDERLKDVQGEFTKGLEAIRDINPIAFSWKENSGLYDDDIIYYGFSAQNVQGSLPQAISHSYGGKLQVSQLTLMATAINAIKELDIKVESIPTLADQSLYSKIADFLRGIAEQSTAVVDNITAKFITADNVDSNKVQTNELCVKRSNGNSICVTGDQLNTLLNGEEQITAPSNDQTAPSDPVPPPTDEGTPPVEETPPAAEPPLEETTPAEESAPKSAPEPEPAPEPPAPDPESGVII